LCPVAACEIQSALPSYERMVDTFLAGPFRKSHVAELLDSWSSQIRPHVMESAGRNGAQSASAWDKGVQELRQIIEDARADRGYSYK
jgi:hypothetical protein